MRIGELAKCTHIAVRCDQREVAGRVAVAADAGPRIKTGGELAYLVEVAARSSEAQASSAVSEVLLAVLGPV